MSEQYKKHLFNECGISMFAPGLGGGYSNIFISKHLQVCALPKGMVFKPFWSEMGNGLSGIRYDSWKKLLL